jgi:hypothetical protein
MHRRTPLTLPWLRYASYHAIQREENHDGANGVGSSAGGRGTEHGISGQIGCVSRLCPAWVPVTRVQKQSADWCLSHVEKALGMR